jgi:hypothetical protein
MLSWVWQGVCSAVTLMEPMVKVESCEGVEVTRSQSLPPIMSRGKDLSW